MSSEKNNEIAEVIRGERDFLHDIANQIVVAQGMGSLALKSLQKIENFDVKIIEKLQKTVKATDEMMVLLKKRREYLINFRS
jgi:hypothetical protein